MRIRVFASILALAISSRALVLPLAAQSLAAVAKQEEERRKTIKQPAKVLTNKDLESVPAAAAPAATPVASPAADAKGATKSATATSSDKDEDGSTQKAAPGAAAPAVKDQAYWSSHFQALQVQLNRDQTYVDALQTRANTLNTDFVNRDDPAQRSIIAADRQKTLDELTRLTVQTAADKKALADFLEDARRAGVPPGWLR